MCLGIQSTMMSQQTTPVNIENKSVLAVTQKHIRWGSTKNPLEGLTISWTNATAATTDQIKWGYTTGYEIGTFSNTSITILRS